MSPSVLQIFRVNHFPGRFAGVAARQRDNGEARSNSFCMQGEGRFAIRGSNIDPYYASQWMMSCSKNIPAQPASLDNRANAPRPRASALSVVQAKDPIAKQNLF